MLQTRARVTNHACKRIGLLCKAVTKCESILSNEVSLEFLYPDKIVYYIQCRDKTGSWYVTQIITKIGIL